MTWSRKEQKTATWEMRGFSCCFMAGSWVLVFGYGFPDLYADKNDVFVQVWQNYGQLERERSGDTSDRDPGGSGRPPCIG